MNIRIAPRGQALAARLFPFAPQKSTPPAHGPTGQANFFTPRPPSAPPPIHTRAAIFFM